jgi:phytol kinase
MMLLMALLLIAGLLVCNELWSRHHRTHGELSRKFIHITVGSLVAFWPFWLTWSQIEWVSLAFLVVLGLSKQFKIFQAIHSVQRPTQGEFLFAIAVGAVALMTHDKWIYAAALLQMSLADGLAAVFGVKYGRRHAYFVFGHDKSLVGSATFFVVSVAILIGYSLVGETSIGIIQILGLSSVATVIENLGVAGLDNLLVPLAIAVSLRLLA